MGGKECINLIMDITVVDKLILVIQVALAVMAMH
jgi:hypothetical protein